jgi:D-alanyl-D-alanine carboxypeptidase/D-alanyl-D-alanine-endopeptidase (penicillin-binding protein 4)
LPTSYPPRSQDPARDVATLFARQLKVAGIDVGNVIGNAVGQQTASSAGDDSSAGNGASIATVHSAPLSQILRLTLQQSDNTLIEEFGRLVALAQKAPNSPAGATKAVLATVKRTGVDTEGTNMADCSGLSSGSRVSVNTLVDVQEKFLNDADAAAVEGLSVVGVSGTAFEHQFTRKSAGLVRLKTGTLSGVTSMAGNVVRRGGGILYFAIIINDAPQMWDAGAGLDRFADSLVDL